ncbi:MAG TPA: hypothetical protein VL461_09710 [Dictyobacter sp.]|jgi:hypothetical protein|nr:hypothetical protein [Dictyobacter sp.]
MQKSNMGSMWSLMLLGAALLMFVLQVISIIGSFFWPVQEGLQSSWPSYLIVLVLAGLVVIGAFLVRTRQEIPVFSQRIAIPSGLILGMVAAILLYIPGVNIALFWAAFGLAWLIALLFQNPATLGSVSWLFALISIALYVVFAAVYSTCACVVTQRSSSIKQGMWSSFIAVVATFLGTVLIFTLIDAIAHFFFHTESNVVSLAPVSGVSPLLSFIVSYQGIVEIVAMWLIIPVIVGMLVSLISASIARRTIGSSTLASAE